MNMQKTAVANSLSHPTVGLLLAAFLAGPSHAQGRLYSWGIEDQSYSDYGQVSDTPEGADFIDMAAGRFSSVAVLSDGTLHSWGWDGNGQVTGTPTGTGFAKVAGGSGHFLALRTDGTIASWGSDSYGLVSNTPVEPGFTQIAAETIISMALRPDGSIVTWGYNGGGQVSDTPIGPGYLQVEVGFVRCWALRQDGSIEWWGQFNSSGVINHPTDTGYTQISVSENYGLALRADGSIQGWGSASMSYLTDAPIGPGFLQVAAGYNHAHALHADGTVVSWGADQYGLSSDTPTGPGYSKISSAYYHVIVLRDDNPGTAYCFGDGSGVNCPCSATGATGRGCLNSSGAGALMIGSGPAYLAVERFQLDIENAPPNVPGLLLRGSNQTNGGLGGAVGDGLLCTGGQTVRSHIQLSSANGTLSFTGFAGQSFGSSIVGLGVPTHYQFWYRDAANTCSGLGFNFSNAWTTNWLP